MHASSCVRPRHPVAPFPFPNPVMHPPRGRRPRVHRVTATAAWLSNRAERSAGGPQKQKWFQQCRGGAKKAPAGAHERNTPTEVTATLRHRRRRATTFAVLTAGPQPVAAAPRSRCSCNSSRTDGKLCLRVRRCAAGSNHHPSKNNSVGSLQGSQRQFQTARERARETQHAQFSPVGPSEGERTIQSIQTAPPQGCLSEHLRVLSALCFICKKRRR